LLGIFALLCVALVAFAQQANVGNGVSAVPQEVTLRGKIVCFHDEFKRLYNADVDCRVDGHRGVLRAEDGSYYGMLPNIRSYVLCLEPKMLGREVEVKARLFPKSMIVQVNSHKVFDEQGKAFEAIYWCDT
jgi:hypothetical protein